MSERKSIGPKDQEKSTCLQYDKEEIDHHELIAKEWWDIRGPMKTLHGMNELRISLIWNGLVNTGRLKGSDLQNDKKNLSGVKILDVGCGGGILSENLAKFGAAVTGIDPSEKLIDIATFHAKHNCGGSIAPNYIPTTIEEHSDKFGRVYDVVIASEVIEHVTNKESFVKGCIAAVKPGGSLFFTTLNRNWLSYVVNIIFGEFILNVVPRGQHQYEKFITPQELSAMLDERGCKVQLVRGMFYDIVRNKWIHVPTSMFSYVLHATCK